MDYSSLQVSLNHYFSNFLFRYRNMPHITTEKTPEKQFLNKQIHTYLPLLKLGQIRTVSGLFSCKNKAEGRKVV